MNMPSDRNVRDSTFLTPEEMVTLTGRKNRNKQIEALRSMHMPFWINAIGRPIVCRIAIVGPPTTSTAAKNDDWQPTLG